MMKDGCSCLGGWKEVAEGIYLEMVKESAKNLLQERPRIYIKRDYLSDFCSPFVE